MDVAVPETIQWYVLTHCLTMLKCAKIARICHVSHLIIAYPSQLVSSFIKGNRGRSKFLLNRKTGRRNPLLKKG